MTQLDGDKMQAFADSLIRDLSGYSATIIASIGDRLGLYKDLHTRGPATSAELAARMELHERYVREWLHGARAAGHVGYDRETQRFSVPPEFAPLLAHEEGEYFIMGTVGLLLDLGVVMPSLQSAFRRGGGVPMSMYSAAFWESLERATVTFFAHQLVQAVMPAMPDVVAKLQQGALVADVGCGAGRALIALAQAFPRSRFVGYDVLALAVAQASARAVTAGVADRVTFRHLDVIDGLQSQYDVITTFDVIHDSPDPMGILRAVRRALAPDGTFIWREISSKDVPEDNTGPLATVKYCLSLQYCLTTSLAEGGLGLGAMGMPESVVRMYAAAAGFNSVRLLPGENAWNAVYEIKP